jgi:hypothetical protein
VKAEGHEEDEDDPDVAEARALEVSVIRDRMHYFGVTGIFHGRRNSWPSAKGSLIKDTLQRKLKSSQALGLRAHLFTAK